MVSRYRRLGRAGKRVKEFKDKSDSGAVNEFGGSVVFFGTMNLRMGNSGRGF